MLRRRRDDDVVRVGDPVIAVADIGAIPEGTRGTVKLVDGLTWVRYWVQWDSGAWTGTVGGEQVVRADRLDAYRERKAAEMAQAAARAEQAAAPTDAAPATTTDASDPASRVPAHLLERSRLARERKASAAAG